MRHTGLRERVTRVALAACAATIGVAATCHTLGYALRGVDIERAIAISPNDARVQAIQGLALIQPTTSPADRKRAVELGKAALKRDPTVVSAVDVLGLVAALEEHEQRSRALFGYAMRLSRRDLRSQVWAIETAVSRGDITDALFHYDIALRTSADAPDLLFPVLSQAIADPLVRAALVTRLAAKPAWSEAFVSYAADRGPAFGAVATLLLDLRRRGISFPDYIQASLIGRLIEHRQYDAAWRYYASIRSAERKTPRNGLFNVVESPTVFDWIVSDDAGVSSSLGGGLAFSVAPGTGGSVVRQLQLLPPGQYKLDGRSAEIDQPDTSWPYWLLACNDGRELGRVAVPSSSREDGRFNGALTVPADCPVQWLSLVSRPSDNPQGVQGLIREMRLQPYGSL